MDRSHRLGERQPHGLGNRFGNSALTQHQTCFGNRCEKAAGDRYTSGLRRPSWSVFRLQVIAIIGGPIKPGIADAGGEIRRSPGQAVAIPSPGAPVIRPITSAANPADPSCAVRTKGRSCLRIASISGSTLPAWYAEAVSYTGPFEYLNDQFRVIHFPSPMNDLGRQVVAYCNAIANSYSPGTGTCRTLAGRCAPSYLIPCSARSMTGRVSSVRIQAWSSRAFPRSANSFSVFAFLNSGAGDYGPGPSCAFARRRSFWTAKYGIPAILLVRTPEDAVIAGVAKDLQPILRPTFCAPTPFIMKAFCPLREHYVMRPVRDGHVGCRPHRVCRKTAGLRPSFAPVTPDRQCAAQQGVSGAGKTRRSREPSPGIHRSLFRPHYSPGALLTGARAAHECMLAAAAEDGTNMTINLNDYQPDRQICGAARHFSALTPPGINLNVS